jgi:hypothetical protein
VRLIYTAQSKREFYCRDAVCEFVLRQGHVPLNPFRVFGYFLGDRVERDTVRRANFALQKRADELWVFGTQLADGVLAEIAFAHTNDQTVRTFSIETRADEIREVAADALTFEAELLPIDPS